MDEVDAVVEKQWKCVVGGVLLMVVVCIDFGGQGGTLICREQLKNREVGRSRNADILVQ